ncbi:MAG: FtsB family cell division protein [Gemmatimonadaceae bacterium]
MARTLIWAAIILAALYFAVQGGEYSTVDIIRQQRAVAAVTIYADSLQRTVDSLRRAERAVRTDPITQERIAREEFGFVRGDEILYRLIPDSGAAALH